MLAGGEAFERVTDMVGRGSEEADGFDAAVFEKFSEGVVGGGAIVGFAELLAAVGTKVGDGSNGAVGVFVELKAGAEASSDDADAKAAILSGNGKQCGGEKSSARPGHDLHPLSL